MQTHVRSYLRAAPRTARIKIVLPVAILAACFWAVKLRFEGFDAALLSQALASITPAAWSISLAATFASFLAVARYDAMFHGWLATGVARSRAALTGAASIALSQFLGFGLFTGTLCRWRMLPDVSLPTAAAITSYVSAAFMVSLGLLTGLAFSHSGFVFSGTTTFSAMAVCAAIGLCILSLRQPAWLPFAIPPIPLMLRIIAATSIDVAFAALAFWILLPGDLGLSLPLVFSVFLLGLGAGLLSGTPFGLGPFEVCILTLLPQVPTANLLAAILGFRLVFFAIPACLAFIVLAWPPSPAQSKKSDVQRPLPPMSNLAAEAGFAAISSAHDLSRLAQSVCVTAMASQSLVTIGDPVYGRNLDVADLDELHRIARTSGLMPMIYKCSGRSAAAARRAGWAVIATSEEAWMRPAGFSLEVPECRQLRRKLRHAQRAQVVVKTADHPPIEAMSAVAHSWSKPNGGERGFSMGQYSHQYVAGQNVFLAFQGDNLVAFATFHTGPENWALDLLRSSDRTPDGTMHALIVAAIQQAKLEGIVRVSLAAMPLKNAPWPLSALSKRSCANGLRQFKSSFAPNTQTLYAAAPTRLGLVLGGVDILLRIRYPDAPTVDQKSNAEFLLRHAKTLPRQGLPFTRFAFQRRI